MERYTARQQRLEWRKRPRRNSLALVLALVVALTAATIAGADSRTITFESPTYMPGSIQGQDGWAGQTPPGVPINPAYDQAVVTNTYGYTSFGGQSWRISNAVTSGSFADWPFSPSLNDEAGETLALNGNGVLTFSDGTRQSHFEVQLDFASTTPSAEQSGLQISTAPDRGDGARMSFIRMRDTSTGLAVDFIDYQDRSPYGTYGSPVTAAAGCGPEDDFVTTTVASGLDRSRPHTVKLTMDFVDGPRNDVVKVYVDGTRRHTGGSWEDYYRWCTESGGGTGTATFDQSRTVDSMIFQARTSGGTCGAPCLGKGFLIDNLSYGSSAPIAHKVTGGGTIEDPIFSPAGDLLSLPAIVPSLAGGGAQASFGLSVQSQGSAAPTGNLVYHDHGSGDDIRATSFTMLTLSPSSTTVCANGTHAKLEGTATVNGTPNQSLTVEVDDCGEPGTSDTFEIHAGAYNNGPETLLGGNIKIH
jgi:hypothetical protein